MTINLWWDNYPGIASDEVLFWSCKIEGKIQSYFCFQIPLKLTPSGMIGWKKAVQDKVNMVVFDSVFQEEEVSCQVITAIFIPGP